jgi:hypothetical protein
MSWLGVMMCSIRESRRAAKQGQNTNPILAALCASCISAFLASAAVK